MSRRRVVECRRNHVEDVDLIIVGETVEFAGRDALLHMRRQVIEELRREAAGNPHLRDVVRGFQLDGHRGQTRSSSLMLVFDRVFASTCLTMTAQ